MTDNDFDAAHSVRLCNANGKGSITLNILEWEAFFLIAQCYGWQPMGTIIDIKTWDPVAQRPMSGSFAHVHLRLTWDGSYLEPSNQAVVHLDAVRLAQHMMLASALRVLPMTVQRSLGTVHEDAIDEGIGATLSDLWDRLTDDMIEEFISVVKQGAFYVSHI